MIERAVFLILSCLILSACDVPEKGRVFFYEPLQWTIKIPAGYADMPAERRQQIEIRGQEAMQDVLGQPVPVLSTYVLGVEKGRTNSMIALLHPYDPGVDGEYRLVQNQTFDAIELAYKQRAMNFNAERNFQKLGGQEFYCQFVTMFPRPDITIKQTTCDALIKQQSFSFSTTCDREAECQKQQSAWKQSLFGVKAND